MNKLKKSTVYSVFWNFAFERQEIFFNRLKRKNVLTRDPILKQFKFTNVYRAADRVSQYLIKNVIYDCKDNNPYNVFFRILLFKIFNKIRTWEELEAIQGEIHVSEFSERTYSVLLNDLKRMGPIFSSAYILPTHSGTFKSQIKHVNFLNLLRKMLDDNLPVTITQTRNLQEVFLLLVKYPLLGDFLAFQFAIDINYSNLVNHSEMDFVMAGPGAKSGIEKCFIDIGHYSYEDVIKIMVENQEKEFQNFNLDFKTLFGRKLHLIDAQNLFCEVDKYTRVSHPEIKTSSNRHKIKSKYIQNRQEIDYFFPPKWNLNEKIKNEIF